VVIQRADIFDTTEAKHWLPRLVNGLHVTTAERVIAREILVHPGEPYDSAKVAETARHLRALGVFNKVRLDTVTTDTGFVLKVFAQDGWSTQVDFRFRSAGKQTDWQAALLESNLLGTASFFAIRYRHTPDRNSVGFQFVQPRLIARTVSLGLRYETRSDGKRALIQVERPFFSLSDKAAVSTSFDIRNERVLQFRDGISSASDSLRRRYVYARVEVAKALKASSRGYLRVGLNGQVRREDYSVWPAPAGAQTVTGTIGAFLEDVDVSRLGRIGVYAAPAAFGYSKGGVGLLAQARIGTGARKGFAWLDARVNGVYTSAGLDSGSVTLGGTAVYIPERHHLFIGHADIGWIKNPLPGTEFDLGFAVGPRAFPIHAFTGNRTYFTTAEYRFIFGEDLFKSLNLGVAGFFDHGGAWYLGSSRRTGTDLGFGFRLSPSRAASSNPTRLDFAYRFKNDQQKAGWVFVVASGLVFNTQPRQ
jgi:hypothetical protein